MSGKNWLFHCCPGCGIISEKECVGPIKAVCEAVSSCLGAFLDEGFEELYTRVKAVLETEKQAHKEDILLMKQLITEITEKSVTIQSEEVRNRRLVERRFSQERKKVKSMRNSSTVAKQYYTNMAKLNYVDAQFMDKKK